MAITTVDNLLDYIRQELNSETVGGVDTYALWKDAEIINYIDQAQQEFSRYTLCLPDNSTYAINVVSGTSEYTYNSLICEIRGGYLSTLNRRIYAISFPDFERSWLLNADRINVGGDWEDDTGAPKFIITDLEQASIRLWPEPTDNDTLTLYVYKAADHVDSTDDNLEIDSQFRLGLTYKVMSLAYSKQDSLETEDLQKSMLMGQKWKSFLEDAKAYYDQRFKRIR